MWSNLALEDLHATHGYVAQDLAVYAERLIEVNGQKVVGENTNNGANDEHLFFNW